jgi:hypothetical protein
MVDYSHACFGWRPTLQKSKVQLVPTRTDIFGASLAGNVMLPGENARIATTTFDDWLSAGTQ